MRIFVSAKQPRSEHAIAYTDDELAFCMRQRAHKNEYNHAVLRDDGSDGTTDIRAPANTR